MAITTLLTRYNNRLSRIIPVALGGAMVAMFAITFFMGLKSSAWLRENPQGRSNIGIIIYAMAISELYSAGWLFLSCALLFVKNKQSSIFGALMLVILLGAVIPSLSMVIIFLITYITKY